MKTLGVIFLLLSSVLAGCISETQEFIDEEIPSSSPPERMSFTAPLMSNYSNNTDLILEEYVSEGPVLLIWVAAGLSLIHI